MYNQHDVVSMMISADWHLGATDPNRFRLELFRTVEHKLKLEKTLDLFIVAGDIFDMKESFSSDTVKVLFLIIKDILDLTEEYGTQIRFIGGTRTHDAMQLETLEVVLNSLMRVRRVKFIHEVTYEIVFGLNVLYLPEEYVESGDLYYKPYLNRRYDFIFGHGPTDLMWYMRDQNPTVEKYSSARVFKVDELCNIANYVFFGHFHYHIDTGPNKRFKSIGPLSRWEFDKDDDCGLYFLHYDSISKLATEEFVVNEYAPILPTITFPIRRDYDVYELNKKIQNKIDPLKNKSDKIRLIVTIDVKLKDFIMMRDFILASFGNIPGVTLLLKPVGEESEEESTKGNTSKEEKDLIEERPYLYDKSMHDEARISAFIKKKTGTNISLESIVEVIKPNDNRIKNREE